MDEHYEIIRFHFDPIEDEDPAGADVFVQMRMPMTQGRHAIVVNQIEDAISSYIDAKDQWNFETLARDVAQHFDSDARIVNLTTFVI